MELAAAAAAVAAVAVVVATVTAAAFFTAASATVMLGVELLGGGVAHELYKTGVAHRLASELVVEVHEHLLVGDLDDLSLDAHAFLRHHGHAGTRADVLGVKLAVDVENFLFEFIDEFGVLHSEGFMRLEGEIKLVALLQSHDVILETLDEGQVDAKYKGIGMFLVELEHTGLFFTVDDKDLINELHVFTCFDFHSFVFLLRVIIEGGSAASFVNCDCKITANVLTKGVVQPKKAAIYRI